MFTKRHKHQKYQIRKQIKENIVIKGYIFIINRTVFGSRLLLRVVPTDLNVTSL